MRIGVLDSGEGGRNALRFLKDLSVSDDFVFFADRKNAPYGTKSREELVKILNGNIRTLREKGVDKVLIACCTASTVYQYLDSDVRKISVPIVKEIAKEAKIITKNKRIAVLATDFTVKSHTFRSLLDGCFVKEISAQPLVSYAERGETTENISEEALLYLKSILTKENLSNCDTLILGCTHFPSFEGAIRALTADFGVLNTVNSAKVGAELMMKIIKGKEL